MYVCMYVYVLLNIYDDKKNHEDVELFYIFS